MSKYFETIKKWASHNSGLVASIVVCALLLFWAGCQVTTENPFDPQEKVTQSELEAEVQMYVQKVQSAYEDIERQELIRSTILEAGWAIAQGGAVDPLGLATTLMGVCGLGAIYDNRTKNKVIVSKSNALAQMAEALKTKENTDA